MIDFTSALYLGFKHGSAELTAWSELTTGKPAALNEFAESRQLGRRVANMQGLEEGLCAPSTLHLYWDLFGWLRTRRVTLFIDEKIYPVSRYGIERLHGSNIRVHTFRHLCTTHLFKVISDKLVKNSVPVLLTDGWCPQCGKPAPLNEYAEIISPMQGAAIIDDTQAFGILGERKTGFLYGNGGGGIFKWFGVQFPVVTITSLAKAFGVPMAVVSGSANFIRTFRATSETRVNSSGLSAAHLSAGLNALHLNKISGEKRRSALLKNVQLFRDGVIAAGINLKGSIFPVQSITDVPGNAGVSFSENLKKRGVDSIVTSRHAGEHPSLSFIIRADHTVEEIKNAVDIINSLV